MFKKKEQDLSTRTNLNSNVFAYISFNCCILVNEKTGKAVTLKIDSVDIINQMLENPNLQSFINDPENDMRNVDLNNFFKYAIRNIEDSKKFRWIDSEEVLYEKEEIIKGFKQVLPESKVFDVLRDIEKEKPQQGGDYTSLFGSK